MPMVLKTSIAAFAVGTIFSAQCATKIAPNDQPQALNRSKSEIAAIKQCEMLAANNWDNDRSDGVAGVSFEDIDTEAALPACELAFKVNPKRGTVLFALARIYNKLGAPDKELKFILEGVKLNHPSSIFGLSRKYNPAHLDSIPPNGETKNASKARELAKRAADLGNVPAMTDYAKFVLAGGGGYKDCEEGKEWLWRAVKAKHPIATAQFGIEYHYGGCVKKDYGQAMNFYLEAKALGSTYAETGLKKLSEDAAEEAADERRSERQRKITACESRASTIAGQVKCQNIW